jgi:DHA1 family tetracycline resistance protein-like MFS transporter
VGWLIVGVSDCWIGTAFAYVADTTKSNVRTRYFAFLTAAIASGFIVGPATSGFVSRISFVAPLYVLIAVLGFATIWGYFSMPESLPPAQRATVLPLSHLNPLTQARDILQFLQLRLLLLSYLLFWSIVIVPSSNLPSLISDRLNWTPEQISPLLITFGIIVVLVQLVVLRLCRKNWSMVRSVSPALASFPAMSTPALFKWRHFLLEIILLNVRWYCPSGSPVPFLLNFLRQETLLQN